MITLALFSKTNYYASMEKENLLWYQELNLKAQPDAACSLADFQNHLYQRPADMVYDCNTDLARIFTFLMEKCSPADVTFFCTGQGFLENLKKNVPRALYSHLKKPQSAQHLFNFLNAMSCDFSKDLYSDSLLWWAISYFDDPPLVKDLIKHEIYTQNIIKDILGVLEISAKDTSHREAYLDILSTAHFEKDPAVIANQAAAKAFTPKAFILKRK